MDRIGPKTTKLLPLSSKDIFLAVKKGIRMNPRVYLIQSTAKVILHISTEFQGDFFEIK